MNTFSLVVDDQVLRSLKPRAMRGGRGSVVIVVVSVILSREKLITCRPTSLLGGPSAGTSIEQVVFLMGGTNVRCTPTAATRFESAGVLLWECAKSGPGRKIQCCCCEQLDFGARIQIGTHCSGGAPHLWPTECVSRSTLFACRERSLSLSLSPGAPHIRLTRQGSLRHIVNASQKL